MQLPYAMAKVVRWEEHVGKAFFLAEAAGRCRIQKRMRTEIARVKHKEASRPTDIKPESVSHSRLLSEQDSCHKANGGSCWSHSKSVVEEE